MSEEPKEVFRDEHAYDMSQALMQSQMEGDMDQMVREMPPPMMRHRSPVGRINTDLLKKSESFQVRDSIGLHTGTMMN